MSGDSDAQTINPAPTPPEAPKEDSAPTETPPPVGGFLPIAETQTAQIPANEPLAPQTEPITQSSLPPPAVATPNARDLLVKARAAFQNRKTKKLEKILEALTKKDKISNDEVEKLLHVSDATATRYLAILEKEGRIVQAGKTGRFVIYTKGQ